MINKSKNIFGRTVQEAAYLALFSVAFFGMTVVAGNAAFSNGSAPVLIVSELTSEDLDAIDPNMMPIETSKPNLAKTNPGTAPSDDELLIAKLETILDRNGISPGAIDGIHSNYLELALAVFNEKTESQVSFSDRSSITSLIRDVEKKSELFVEYEISPADVKGPFISNIPDRIQDQSDFETLAFTSVEEALAEKFHMDEAFLKRLNPNVDFKISGNKIQVANIGSSVDVRVTRIKADMSKRKLLAYDRNDKVVAVYPASIGSPQNPSPRGEFKVRNKAGFPKYTLSASNTFEPIDDGQQVVVAAGPNNPVGIAWIGLSKKSYGIHGTPWPERVGEAGSHGCIRLTNWDAMELARLVRTGIKVVIE